jgi:sensor histidine kinase YesM
VKDDGLGSNAKKVMDGSSGGVGLKNTDQRLKSIFGAGSGLRIRSNEWGYSVSFFIPYEETNQATQATAQAEPVGEALNKTG